MLVLCFQRKAEDNGSDLEARLEAMERRLAVPTEVDQALAQVRRLIGRITVVKDHVIIETLEGLVEAGTKCDHKEALYWRKAFEQCARREGEEGFRDLVCDLFGSAEDRRVATAVMNWHKLQRAEGKGQRERRKCGGKPGPDDKDDPPPPMTQTVQYQPQVIAHPPPFMMPYGAPYSSPPSYNVQPRGHRGSQGKRPWFRSQPQGAASGTGCYGCGQEGHKVIECQVIKEFRSKQKS